MTEKQESPVTLPSKEVVVEFLEKHLGIEAIVEKVELATSESEGPVQVTGKLLSKYVLSGHFTFVLPPLSKIEAVMAGSVPVEGKEV